MHVSRFRWKVALFWAAVFPTSLAIAVTAGAFLGAFITALLGLGRPF